MHKDHTWLQHGNHTWIEKFMYKDGSGIGTKICIIVSWVVFIAAYIGEILLIVQWVIFGVCFYAWRQKKKLAPKKLDSYLIRKRNIDVALRSVYIQRNNRPYFLLVNLKCWLLIKERIDNRMKLEDTVNKARLNLANHIATPIIPPMNETIPTIYENDRLAMHLREAKLNLKTRQKSIKTEEDVCNVQENEIIISDRRRDQTLRTNELISARIEAETRLEYHSTWLKMYNIVNEIVEDEQLAIADFDKYLTDIKNLKLVPKSARQNEQNYSYNAKLTDRPEMRIWHSSLNEHYKAVMFSIMSVTLMAITKYGDEHAYVAWSLVINTIVWLNMLVIAWGCYSIFTSMLTQIRVFYRYLAWEKLCEKGYRIIEIHDNPGVQNRTKYDIRPVKSIISEGTTIDPYYEFDTRLERLDNSEVSIRSRIAMRRVDLAKKLHSQALKEQLRVGNNLALTVYELIAVIAVLVVLIVLPAGYETTIDVLYATTLAVQATALISGCSAIIGWSNAARIYTEACWMLELANSKFSTNEARLYETEIDLQGGPPHTQESWRTTLLSAATINHAANGSEELYIKDIRDTIT